MRQHNELWGYISIHVDDLAFIVRNAKTSITLLEGKFKYKLKGTGSISYHLGCDFFKNDEDILYMAPKKEIEKDD